MSSQCANVGNPLENVAEGEVRSCSLAVRYERPGGRRKLTLALSEWLNLEGERGREEGRAERVRAKKPMVSGEDEDDGRLVGACIMLGLHLH